MEQVKTISLVEWQVILQTMNFYKREVGFVDYDETGKLKFYDNDPCINGVHACPVTRTDVLKNISDINKKLNNMKQLPTAEQLLHIKGITCVQAEEIAKFMIEFAKIHVKAALESAAEKADTKEVRGVCDDYRVVDEKSILNAYNLDNIK